MFVWFNNLVDHIKINHSCDRTSNVLYGTAVIVSPTYSFVSPPILTRMTPDFRRGCWHRQANVPSLTRSDCIKLWFDNWHRTFACIDKATETGWSWKYRLKLSLKYALSVCWVRSCIDGTGLGLSAKICGHTFSDLESSFLGAPVFSRSIFR